MTRVALQWTVDGQDRVLPVPPDRPITIGRDGSCDIAFDDAAVSRHHAEVFMRDEGCVVRHLSATNPTYVNGRIALGETVIGPGDVLWVPVRLVHVVAADGP
jgi:pSer/pThr/pTyr-binding forkhead associated (FHA) protein